MIGWLERIRYIIIFIADYTGKGYTESMWLYAVEFNWKVRRRNIGYVGNAYILVIEEFFAKNNIEL